MTILEALKTNDIRIANGPKRWLVYDQTSGCWEVYERIKGRSIGLISTKDEEEAIRYFV